MRIIVISLVVYATVSTLIIDIFFLEKNYFREDLIQYQKYTNKIDQVFYRPVKPIIWQDKNKEIFNQIYNPKKENRTTRRKRNTSKGYDRLIKKGTVKISFTVFLFYKTLTLYNIYAIIYQRNTVLLHIVRQQCCSFCA